MISTTGCFPAGVQLDGRLHQRPHLHGVEAGLEHAEADAPGAEHRVLLAPRLGGGEQVGLLGVEAGGGPLHEQLLHGREELVQRRVEQAHGDRAARPWRRGCRGSRPSGRRGAARGRRSPPRACRRGSSPARSGRRSSARNMCSVRQRPMPSAPKSRATLASSPVSALARTASLPFRTLSAQVRMVVNSFGGSASASAMAPSTTSPVVPSSEMTSPSSTVTPPAVKWWSAILTASAPTTAGMPQPRATTAAWLTRPPRAVRMPSATCMPWTSSGEVSLRTRTTFSPRSEASTASSAVKYTRPTAAPGEAGQALGDHRLVAALELRVQHLVEVVGGRRAGAPRSG